MSTRNGATCSAGRNPVRGKYAVVVAAGVALVLAAASTVAIAAIHENGRLLNCGPTVTARNRIQVVLTNMGGPMMSGGAMGNVRGGMMRVVSDRNTVPAGRVTLIATNAGSVAHELVVLPLRRGQIVGTRPLQSDGRIEERGSLGEASASCRAGSGDGIAPGATGWVTLHLPAGRYELVCNLPGHYAAGMYTQLVS